MKNIDWNNWANVQRLYKRLPLGIITQVSNNLDLNFATVSDAFRIKRDQRRTDVAAIYDEAVRLIKLRGINFK